MPTSKERITANLDTEDYQWIDEKAELTGNSRAGIIRQIVRGLRLGNPGLLAFGDKVIMFADEAGHTGDEGSEAVDIDHGDESEEAGLKAFSTE